MGDVIGMTADGRRLALPTLDGYDTPEEQQQAADAVAASVVPFQLGSQVEVGRRMLLEVRGRSAEQVVHTRGNFHRYDADKGTWERVPEDAPGRIIQGYDGVGVVRGGREKFLKVGKTFRDGSEDCAAKEVRDDTFFDAAAAGIAFKNGFAVISGDGVSIVPHAPEHRAWHAKPYDYDGNATCPEFITWLEEVFGDATDDERRDRIKTLQQFFGVCLVGRATEFVKSLVLLGEGASNGKSLLLDIISRLFPAQVRCSVPPNKWGDDQSRAMLAGMMLNVVSELPDGDILNSADFKAIIDGSMVECKVVYKPKFNFTPRCGHVFACNALPGTQDVSNGFFRRILLVQFTRQFEQNQAKRDDIFARCAREEQGIIRWALDGAVEALSAGKYTAEPASSTHRLSAWKDSADPVKAFLKCAAVKDDAGELLVIHPAGQTTALDMVRAKPLYEAYRRWAEQSGRKVMSNTKFGERLGGLLPQHTTPTADSSVVAQDVKDRDANGVFYRVRLLHDDKWTW